MGDHIVSRKYCVILIRVMRNTRGYPPAFSGMGLFPDFASSFRGRACHIPKRCRTRHGALSPRAPRKYVSLLYRPFAAALTTSRGGVPAHVIACRCGRVVSPRPRAIFWGLGGGLLLRQFSFFHSKRFRYMVARGGPRGSTCGCGVERGSDRFSAGRNAAYIHPFAQLHTACSSRGRYAGR